jgi:hypothetical protein
VSDTHELRRVALAAVAEAEQAGVVMRVIGGVAVALHADDDLEPGLRRSTADVDFVVSKGGRAKLDQVFAAVGLTPDRQFNSLNGAERRIYYSEQGLKADVFVGEFRMCHVISMDEGRLVLDTPTAPLAELVITKAQVVELTHKDTIDLVALLRDHDLGEHDDGVINTRHVAELCGRDWGLWRTVHQTLSRVDALLEGLAIDDQTRTRATERIAGLRGVIDEAPKTQKWKLRNRIGDRKVWYELPEEPTGATIGQIQVDG